jgi:hypothetical protein
MPDKYVPNSSVMGGGAPRKIAFFGRDKIGDEKPADAAASVEAAVPATAEIEPETPTPNEVPTPENLVNSDHPTASSSVPDSPIPDSPASGSPSYGRPRAVDGVHPERQSAPDSPAPDSPAPDSRSVNLWSSLPQVEGHLRLPNIIVDHLYQLLDLQERSVYEQLYRLSHGYGKSTCRIGYPQLAVRSGMGRTATIQTVERLLKKGLIARAGTALGGRKEQGSVYWVSAPGSSAPDSPVSGSPGAEPNKIKALKETDKKGGASHQKRDFSDCPDCQGVGMWYPGGFEKGVAKCLHPKLRK